MQAFHPPPQPHPRTYWCRESTSRECWPGQHTDSHNPSHELGPISSSPGPARPSLHKTLIDLMDSCAIHTPSPNKQSVQDLSPFRQGGGARLRRAAATPCHGLRGRRRPARVVNFTAGPRGRFERAVRQFITLQMEPPHPHPHPSTKSPVNQS